MASLILVSPTVASLSLSLSFSNSNSIAGVSLSYSPTLSLSTPASISPSLPLIYCGRGDRKTAKGKRFSHSFGNARPKNKKKGRGPPKSPITRDVPDGEPSEGDAVED